ncbi:hypothetical protein D3C76_1079130 [compost metagenome]
MAGAHADTELLVRTVDQVARCAQGELERPQRVVRASRHDVGQRITVCCVLGLDRSRRRPGRVRCLGGDAGVGNRRAPAFTTDTQRERVHHVLAFRVVVEAVLGQVDHDAFTRARWQDEAGRQDDFRADAWQPGIDTRVGRDHFRVAQIVGGTKVGEGIFVLGLDHLHLADDVLTGRWQGKLQCCDWTGHKEGGKSQAAGDGRKARQHPENPMHDQLRV